MQPLETFLRDYKDLDAQQKTAVDECIKDLCREVIPAARRWHCVDRATKPPIFTVDLFPNKSYKISCQIVRDSDGQFLRLRRVRRHKDIDRNP